MSILFKLLGKGYRINSDPFFLILNWMLPKKYASNGVNYVWKLQSFHSFWGGTSVSDTPFPDKEDLEV